jgi:hypothetical protein
MRKSPYEFSNLTLSARSSSSFRTIPGELEQCRFHPEIPTLIYVHIAEERWKTGKVSGMCIEISVKTLAGSCSPLLRAMFLPLLFQLNPFIALHRFGDRFFDRQTLHARSAIETVHAFGLMENIFGILRL